MAAMQYPRTTSPASLFWGLLSLLTLLIAGWVVWTEHWAQDRSQVLVDVSVNAEVERDLPEFDTFTVVQERKDRFYEFLLPMVEAENQRIRLKRDQLAHWQALADAGENLTERSVQRLTEWAHRYYVETEQPLQDVLDELWLKVDELPPSLVVAQAANESAWGTSRFAREGNNLFGQWCFSAGCGLVPQSRPAGETYEVRRFDEPLQSVRAFMLNLNRHFSYEELRAERAALRASGEAVTGVDLAPHLLAYSTRREAYVEEIIGMINFNNLLDLDQ